MKVTTKVLRIKEKNCPDHVAVEFYTGFANSNILLSQEEAIALISQISEVLNLCNRGKK